MAEQITISEFNNLGKRNRKKVNPIYKSETHKNEAPIAMVLKIKSLSVNQAWQGMRFKTPAYNDYINHVLYLLPKLPVGDAPYKLTVEFGLSSKLNDIDNGLKPFIDCLVKKYDFDDRDIYELNVKKIIIKKGEEYIDFKLETIN